MPQARLSFLIRANYDTLPSPQNLHQWLGTEQSCDLCGTTNATLQHVLSGCKDGDMTKCSRGERAGSKPRQAKREPTEHPLPQTGGGSPEHRQETGTQPTNIRGRVENGDGPGKATPIPKGDQQNHVTARHDAVDSSRKVCTANRADSAMVRGAGDCP